jgi:putative addiction module component (TIGR02574 family)
MNKIDEAWSILKTLPAEKQEMAADALLDFAAHAGDLELDREHMAELERRLQDGKAKSITLDEFRARVRKLAS